MAGESEGIVSQWSQGHPEEAERIAAHDSPLFPAYVRRGCEGCGHPIHTAKGCDTPTLWNLGPCLCHEEQVR